MTFNFSDSSLTRRLPVYLLLDISGSMTGAPIEAVNQGIVMLYNELMNTPQAVETAWISVITFETQANQLIPLTELTNSAPPMLNPGGTTSLGAALSLLGQALDREITANTGDKKGDYKPLVFLLTDGEPTDDWRGGLGVLRSRTQKKPATVIAIGCGPNVNMATLTEVGDHALHLHNADPDTIKQFFQWVSQSVKVASVSANAGGGPTNMPAPPSSWQVTL
jgi:uncharacterized protein YegL